MQFETFANQFKRLRHEKNHRTTSLIALLAIIFAFVAILLWGLTAR